MNNLDPTSRLAATLGVFSRIRKIREALGSCRDICPCHFAGFARKVRNIS